MSELATSGNDGAPDEPAQDDDRVLDKNAQMGQRLRAARQAAKMSLRELARRVGLSHSFVSQVELGRVYPSVGTLHAIVTELGLSLDSLMADGASGELRPGVTHAEVADDNGAAKVVALPFYNPARKTSVPVI